MFQTFSTFVTAKVRDAIIICLVFLKITTDVHGAISFHLVYNLNFKKSTILERV